MESSPKIETYVLPTGEVVQYIDETHTYIVDGAELPSVTSLLNDFYGNAYANVRPEILQKAAEYGTKVHKDLQDLIELREMDDSIPLVSEYQEVQNYFNLVEPIYKIKPTLTEKVVLLHDADGKPVAAGRFDLLCEVDGVLTLADFKTTSTIHRQLVTAQLNLYAIAAYQSGYIKTTDIALGVIHLSGLKSRFLPIPKLDDKFYLQFIK